MHYLSEFFHRLSNLRELISWGGYVVLAIIVFAETGLLIGFFLPGDSLLVTAGVIASTTGLLNIWVLNALLMVCAVVGDAVGFQIGYRAGPALFKRPKSLFFRPDHLRSTKEFYDRHGGKTIVIARFMPFARTFAPVVAGIGQMPYRRFAMFNVVGGVSWVLSMTLLGYFLGTTVSPKRIEHIVYLIIVVSVMPVGLHAFNSWRKSKATRAAVTSSGAGDSAPAANAAGK